MMNIALKTTEVLTLREHLESRKYNVMHLRRRWRSGTVLGALALIDKNMIFGMLSYGSNYCDFTVTWHMGKPVIEVYDTFTDVKIAKRLEERLSSYILKRVGQEKEWDNLEQKFGPRYADGEVYVRRRATSKSSHLVNQRRSAESGLVNKIFAERLASLNLVLRFKPKR